MSEFQKNLELYYNTIEGDGKLYYERRSKQYNSDLNVIKRKIITTPIQIKAFSSMFRNEPHRVTSYFSGIVKKIGMDKSGIFEEKHQAEIYYVAGLAFYRLDMLFNTNSIDTKYKKVRYFILMIFRLLANNKEIPPLNSLKKVEKFSKPIIDILNDTSKTKELFLKSVEIIENSNIDINDKHLVKSKAMTEELIKALNI